MTMTYLELDGVSDELGVLLDDVLEFLLLEVLGHVLTQVKDNLGSSEHFLDIVVLEENGVLIIRKQNRGREGGR